MGVYFTGAPRAGDEIKLPGVQPFGEVRTLDSIQLQGDPEITEHLSQVLGERRPVGLIALECVPIFRGIAVRSDLATIVTAPPGLLAQWRGPLLLPLIVAARIERGPVQS